MPLKGTGLEIRELARELVISNPGHPGQGRIYVTYATGEVSHRRVVWDYLGCIDGHGNDVITFSGGNFNWVMDDLIPPSASPDLPATEAASILRLVNGVTYLQVEGASPKSPWMRTLKWHATEYFPAPKTALQLLSPQAKFQDVGWQVIGGVRLEHLRATQLSGLPGSLTFAGYRQPGEALSALDLWVDASGVLHQMQLELKSSDSSTTMTVAFSQFGQPETITAPAHWIQSGL